MNRVISFRGLSKRTKQWMYGAYFLSPDGETTYIKTNDFTVVEDVEVDPKTVGQFTGLYDKNRKECYDKDHDADGNMITYCDECAGWQFAQIDIPTKDVVINCHNCDGNFMLRDHLHDFEIIGNIYESPEKLK